MKVGSNNSVIARFVMAGYFSRAGSELCEYCVAGRFQANEGSTSCETCPRGKASDKVQQISASVCDYCSAGHYADTEGMDRCRRCPAGRYSTVQGSYSNTSCIACPATKSSEEGSSACVECPAGRYSAFDGDLCNKCKPGTSTLNLGAQRKCIPCLAGYYQTEFGAAECLECPVNFYSTGGDANCTACQNEYYTNNLKGATACLYNPAALSQTRLEQVAESFNNGIAYVVTMLICGVFGGLGYAIFQLRSKDARLVVLTEMQLGGRLSLSAVSLVSEAFLLAILFSGGSELSALGAVILIFRLLHTIPTLFILSFVFTNVQIFGLKTVYKQMFARDHFLQFIYPYASLAFLCCFDCSLIFAMPWYFSDFGKLSQGYPDMRALRLTQGYKVVQDFVRFICNVVYLASTKEKSQDAAVEAFFIINILISLAGIILAAMVLVMKASILIETEEIGGTTSAATGSETNVNEKSSADHDEEAGTDSIKFENNPMHTASVRNSTMARPMREWLASHLPSLDAPSIFAVHQAFENDGIKTFNDLVECIKGKVIDISEVKNYTRAGKLSKMDTLAIIKAIEEVTSTSVVGPGAPLSTHAATRRASIQAVTSNATPAVSNPMHIGSAQIVEAMNAQTQAIIESQQKASLEIVNILKERKHDF